VLFRSKLVQADGNDTFRTVLREVGTFVRLVAGLPRRLNAALDRIDEGRLDVRLPELKQQVTRLERGLRKLAGSIVFAACLLAGTGMYAGGHIEAAIGFGAVDGLLLLWLLFAR
jgi:anti-sigma factor RsiW